MALITWKDSFSVGHSEMDRQHRRLIDLLNGLHEAMVRGEGNNALRGLLTEVLNYTRQHFAAEEALMAKCKFPGRDAHIREHRKLTTQVTEMTKDYESGKIALSMQVLNFLRGWLQGHILGQDKQYSPLVTQGSGELAKAGR